MIAIPVLVLLVLVIFSLATQVTISTRTWQLNRAYLEDSHETVAYGPNSDNNTYKKMDVVLEAENGEITITNRTYDKVYKGTYDASQKDRVTIEGAEGTARISARRYLYLSVGGYRMNFYATDTDVWDRIDGYVGKYSDIIGVVFLEFVFFGVALTFIWSDIKNKFRCEADTLRIKAKWLSLTSFIGCTAPLFVATVISLLTWIIEVLDWKINEVFGWGALLFIVYGGIAVAFIGPVFCVLSLLYSIAYTKRLEKKRNGIMYIVLWSLALVAVMLIAGIAIHYIL